MAFVLFLLLSITVGAFGSPAENHSQRRQTLRQSPQHGQLDYYLDQSDANFENQNQKKANINANGAPSRLETLEPDSEVELLPGAAQPQQPPQQNPVSPNVPGLLPGHRVFIVQMPVPGYRPGGGMGYQPVYIVGAGPQENNNYANNNGYQNTVLLDPSGQVLSPFLGYRGVPQGGPHFVGHGAYSLQQPFNYLYPGAGYQPVGISPNVNNAAIGGGNFRGAIRLTPIPLQVYGNPRQAYENKNSNIEDRSSKSSGQNDSRENYEEKQVENKTD